MKLLSHTNAVKRRSEQSQSIARLLIGSVVTVYLWASALDSTAVRAAWYCLLFLGGAVALHLHILWRPAPSVIRRVLAIGSDLSATSLVLHLTGVYGTALYPIYLWVIVGNGLRFGIPYLFMALAMGVCGFVLVMVYTPFWQQNPTIAIGLLIGMMVLPLFYASVLSELQASNAKLARQIEETAFAATHDALTGLPNRHLFQDRLNQQIKLAQRQRAKLAVVFVDIDKFKHINDNYGHQAGDQVLQEVGRRLRNSARAADTVARLGGDEFVLLVNDISCQGAIVEVARRLMVAFSAPFPIPGGSLAVTGSMGCSIYPDVSDNLDDLIRHADQAMYQIKRAGGSGFQPCDLGPASDIGGRAG